jgi:TubC N-terminal docking domain
MREPVKTTDLEQTEAEAVVKSLCERGIRLWVDGNQLGIRPASQLTPCDLETVKRLKRDIILLLTEGARAHDSGPLKQNVENVENVETSRAPSPLPPQNEAEAERLLAEARAIASRAETECGAGEMTATRRNVVLLLLEVAEEYAANHQPEVDRGWNAMWLLRNVINRMTEFSAMSRNIPPGESHSVVGAPVLTRDSSEGVTPAELAAIEQWNQRNVSPKGRPKKGEKRTRPVDVLATVRRFVKPPPVWNRRGVITELLDEQDRQGEEDVV